MNFWPRKSAISTPPWAVAIVTVCAVLTMLPPQVSSVRYIVGANKGWTSNVNYTIWAQDKHFYTEDWLFFVYDRTQTNVLEVNKTDYENCNSDHPLHNWTTGAGRDVVPLNVTRHFYFISGKGYCYGGMKLAVLVEKMPPPSAPLHSKGGAGRVSLSTFFHGQIVIPSFLAIAAVWDSFFRFC